MSETPATPDLDRDRHLAQELTKAAAALQRSIHLAVEAGLRVTVTVETMHQVGHHHPEPLVEVKAERVIGLT